MRRYQVYLNPNSVAVLDDFEKISGVSRSKIIREAIDRLAQQLLSIVLVKTETGQKRYLLDELAGFIDLKTSKKTNFAGKVDEIYESLH